MTQALGQKSAPKRTAPPANPDGPVQPLDVPDIGAIPVGDRTSVGVQDGQAVIRTEVNGTAIDLRLPLGDRPPAGAPPPEPAPHPPPPYPHHPPKKPRSSCPRRNPDLHSS